MNGESGPERLPPPPAAPLPPPPASTSQRRRRNRPSRAAVLAVSLAGAGWLIWIYGWIAESDTGYPDGLACTGNDPASDAYTSCMYSAERGGAIAWALTLGLATAALVLLVRRRRDRQIDSGQVLISVALVMSAALAVVATVTWIHGAQGGFYEDRLGPIWWNIVNSAGVLVGLAAGWLLAPRPERR